MNSEANNIEEVRQEATVAPVEKMSLVGALGVFGVLFNTYTWMRGEVAEVVERITLGKIGAGVLECFSDEFYKNFAGFISDDTEISPRADPSRLWVDARKNFEAGSRATLGVMVPAGRAAQDPYGYWDWYHGKWENFKLGVFGAKTQVAFQAETADFDAAFNRAVRRDVGEAMLYVYSRMVKAKEYLCWTTEIFAASYVERALARNLVSTNVARNLERYVAVKGVAAPALLQDDGLVYRKEGAGAHVLPTAFAGTTLRIVTRSDIGSAGGAEVMRKFNDRHIFVGRANSDLQLVFDLVCCWVCWLPEVALFGEYNAVLVLPNLTNDDVAGMFQRWGLGYKRLGGFNVARIVHWLSRSVSMPGLPCPYRFTQGDRQRVVLLNAIHRFRYSVHGVRFRRLNQFDSAPCRVRVPHSSWILRCADVYGIVASTEGYGGLLSWNRIEGLAYYRGIALGAVWDTTIQRVGHHWWNLLQMPNGEDLLDSAWRLANAIGSGGVTDAGLTFLGVEIERPKAPVNAKSAGHGFAVTLQSGSDVMAAGINPPEPVCDSDVIDLATGSRQDGCGVYERGPERGAGEWGEPLPAALGARRHGAWYVMTRAYWPSLLGKSFGALVVSKNVEWSMSSSEQGNQPWEIPSCASKEYVDAATSRVIVMGGGEISLRQRGEFCGAQSLPILRTSGGGHYDYKTETPVELIGYMATGVRVRGGNLVDLEIVPSFAVYDSRFVQASSGRGGFEATFF
uniref:Capsid protein n=1 Tax=Phytophthora dsRNA virus 1 TaxID=3071755 RepID=A0AA51BV16_9VIRU|nr:capsid protein [Phytophthora dsRNA virus 1]